MNRVLTRAGRLFVLVGIAIAASACVTPQNQFMMMAQQQSSGRPDRMLEIFEKYNKKGLERAHKQPLTLACNAYLALHDFDRHRECSLIQKDKKVFPPWNDIGSDMIYHTAQALRAENLGDDKGVFHHATASLDEDGESMFPVGAWQFLAEAHARRGEIARSREYIEQIEDWRFRIFWFIQVAEGSMSAMRRNAITKVYLEMDDSKAAKAAFTKPLAGKHFTEYIMDGVFAALSATEGSISLVEQAVKTTLELAVNATRKDKPDPYFMMRLDALFVSGLVAARNGDHDKARLVFEGVLALPNIELLKEYYFDSLWELARLHRAAGRHEEAMPLLVRAIQEVEATLRNITPADERLGYLRRRADV